MSEKEQAEAVKLLAAWVARFRAAFDATTIPTAEEAEARWRSLEEISVKTEAFLHLEAGKPW
jgi:hypothetical protein